MPAFAVAAGAAAVSVLVGWLLLGAGTFVDQACSNVEAVLSSEVVGQELAVRQLTDAVCYHLGRQPPPQAPLVISVHGPPGVGKTLTHQLLAKALYARRPAHATHCPGRHCRGYKVLYGLDYLAGERAARLTHVVSEMGAHLASHPDTLLVVEEYDKMGCEARGALRQVLQNPRSVNATWGRSIVLLESNLGMSALEELVSSAGGRHQVTSEEAERRLRALVFSQWAAAGCEAYEDTLKLTSLIHFYLPYFPLERAHVAELTERELARRARALRAGASTGARSGGRLRLAWPPRVVEFLVEKVEFEGPYPMDGAKGVEAAVTRHVARLLRNAPPRAPSQPPATLVLHVRADGCGLEARLREDAWGSLETGEVTDGADEAAAAAAATTAAAAVLPPAARPPVAGQRAPGSAQAGSGRAGDTLGAHASL